MIHIVSGYFRSGTSAMMHALIAGGMDAAWSEERNKVATNHSDAHYQVNPSGLYEIPLSEYRESNFPAKHEGKLIKVMAWGMRKLARNNYRVIVMVRDPEEIRQSYNAAFRGGSSQSVYGFPEPEVGRQYRVDEFLPLYFTQINELIQRLQYRRDVENVTTVHFRDLIENPEAEFDRLADCGWPIDPQAAAAKIDPSLYRFREESITPGI